MKGMPRSFWWVVLAGWLRSAQYALANSIALDHGKPPSSDVLRVPEGGSALIYLLLAGATCLRAMIYSRRQTSGPMWPDWSACRACNSASEEIMREAKVSTSLHASFARFSVCS
jgi:hypothetical protein